MSSWEVYMGQVTWDSEENKNECWRLAKENVLHAEGIFLGTSGICLAIVDSSFLLPWKNTYPDLQTITKLCLLKSKIDGK